MSFLENASRNLGGFGDCLDRGEINSVFSLEGIHRSYLRVVYPRIGVGIVRIRIFLIENSGG